MEAVERTAGVGDIVDPLRRLGCVSGWRAQRREGGTVTRLLGLCDHHVDVHEDAWDAFGHAGEDRGTCMRVIRDRTADRVARVRTHGDVFDKVAGFGAWEGV